jgi:hypothetical protein
VSPNFPPSAAGVTLANMSLASDIEIVAAWDLVNRPATVLVTFPHELTAAKDRIQLAAAEHGITLSRC